MSEAQTMTLTDFLLARIAEEQATAEHVLETYREFADRPNSIVIAGRSVYDPRRALARCEADRRLVELTLHGCGDDYERVQRALAIPYADHPDFREEWRA